MKKVRKGMKQIDENDDDEGDEVEVEIEKGKEKVLREEQPEITRPAEKKKKASQAGLDDDMIHGLNTYVVNDLGMLRTKIINLEAKEKHRE
ncbi:hypothetical protein QVD17_08415 [Tagetes erecta]|uniref:Uncharacterized protein n=1 Tax=Tagetes erecta TaxID=13708 RepID=A0AAD8P4I7_TARER|nr:hypothetical protein QVD17_08415 [Tagetes erecta]